MKSQNEDADEFAPIERLFMYFCNKVSYLTAQSATNASYATASKLLIECLEKSIG